MSDHRTIKAGQLRTTGDVTDHPLVRTAAWAMVVGYALPLEHLRIKVRACTDQSGGEIFEPATTLEAALASAYWQAKRPAFFNVEVLP